MTITMTITIADISHNRYFWPLVMYFFQVNVLFSMENAKFWPVLTYFVKKLRIILAYFLQTFIVWRCTKIDKYQACQWHWKACSWGVATMSLEGLLAWARLGKVFAKVEIQFSAVKRESHNCHAKTSAQLTWILKGLNIRVGVLWNE